MKIFFLTAFLQAALFTCCTMGDLEGDPHLIFLFCFSM
ncbi:Hypothetical protein, putative [Bodo saltans]|uniref:Membrane-associated protein n=1 Tax=Bodo saltans TaxID=75058 RepID=A0A0S4J0M7_BODSA|nr:Hypothetical protein, putative [Bodo saltans]|eukprot:CUG33821.1 Hypothetical protein, putative [Bodo saltans]